MIEIRYVENFTGINATDMGINLYSSERGDVSRNSPFFVLICVLYVVFRRMRVDVSGNSMEDST